MEFDALWRRTGLVLLRTRAMVYEGMRGMGDTDDYRLSIMGCQNIPQSLVNKVRL